MTSEILFKRGMKNNLKNITLKVGEPAFTIDEGKLYVGAESGKVLINDDYVHPTGDGNSHVPATGTNNNGKYLKAGATENSSAWADIAPDVRTTVLTGLSTSTSAIKNTDSVVVAIGKAQGQIDTKAPINHSITDGSVYGTATTTHYGHVKVTAENGLGVLDGTLSMSKATTSAVGTVKLNSSISSTSTDEAATPSAIKQAYTLAEQARKAIDELVVDGGLF